MFFIARNLLKTEKNSRFIFGRGMGGQLMKTYIGRERLYTAPARGHNGDILPLAAGRASSHVVQRRVMQKCL